MKRMHGLIALLCGLMLVAGPAQADYGSSSGGGSAAKPVKPPTKLTQTIRQKTYKKLEVVQKAYDAKDYAGALSGLDELKAGGDTLNDYERATIYNMYAAIYYAQDNTAKAIESYMLVLRQPNLPEGLQNSTLFALAQMYFVTEDYDKAIAVLKKWFSVVEEPSPDAYVLVGQAYYQQQNYTGARAAILKGLKVAHAKHEKPKENWLALLRAVYYELGDYQHSAKLLEVLVQLYPRPSYYQQLSGMYGLLGDQDAQMATLHAAYVAGMVDGESNLLNLARLYMVENAPYPAVELLARSFRDKQIKVTPDNLQLYAQALSYAKENEKQIPVLEKLAGMTGEAKHYTYLGQAEVALGRWTQAIDAFEHALHGKDLENPDAIRMQLGPALFNAGRLRQARNTFIAAQDNDKYGEAAANWVKFVDAEIQRKQAMN